MTRRQCDFAMQHDARESTCGGAIDIRSKLHQPLGYVGPALGRSMLESADRAVKWSAHAGTGVHVSPAIEQQLDHFDIAVFRASVQRRQPLLPAGSAEQFAPRIATG